MSAKLYTVNVYILNKYKRGKVTTFLCVCTMEQCFNEQLII